MLVARLPKKSTSWSAPTWNANSERPDLTASPKPVSVCEGDTQTGQRQLKPALPRTGRLSFPETPQFPGNLDGRDSLEGAGDDAQAAIITAGHVQERRFARVEPHDGPHLAHLGRQAPPADPATLVVYVQPNLAQYDYSRLFK